jgi:hypothetical protein
VNDIAGIGHNQATPFDLSLEEIEGLLTEARNWLDGSGVNSEADAKGVSKLLDAARQARSTADDARKAEKKPHDDAGKAVQEKWKPVIEKADLVASTCKAALTPWLEKVEAEKRAVAEKARREAKEKMEIAAAAVRAAHQNEGNLAERETAEIMLKSAQRSEAAATRAEKDKAQATGGSRAVGLRTTWRPVIANAREAARHYWIERRPEMETFLVGLAETDVRGGKRQIPGFDVIEEKSAV